jgi:hypothetical protein
VKGNAPGQPPDRRPAILLALGFTVSAFALYAALSFAGSRLLGDVGSTTGGRLVAAAFVAVLLGVDALRARRPGAIGLSCRRQTPKSLEPRHGLSRAALLWGLDAGLVVTTIRVTSLSWAALAVAFLGLVPWWSGLAYALGFTVPVTAMILAVPRRTDPTGESDPEPVWLVLRILDLRGPLKLAGLMTLGGAMVSCLALTLRG